MLKEKKTRSIEEEKVLKFNADELKKVSHQSAAEILKHKEEILKILEEKENT